MSRYHSWLAIWGIGIILLLLILTRGFRATILAKYPFFYAYVFSTLVGASLEYILWVASPTSYEKSYWAQQFITLLVGCGIILEIFRHVLAPYPGAERFATAVGLLTFGLVFCFALAYQWLGISQSAPKGTAIELERDVRTVQAIFLFGIFAVVSYYQIPIGKNLKGMIGGYGVYIGTSLVSLAFRSYAGHAFDAAWNVIQPSSYDVTLLIWLVALWSYHPNPAPDSAVHLEEDYEALAARTKRALGTVRSRLAKPGRM
jgi:hypothetical protein